MSAIADEWRIVSREPFFRAATIVLLVLTALALWNGFTFASQRNSAAEADVSRAVEKRERDRATLRDEASGRVPVNPWGASEPTRAEWTAARSAGPLAALTFGREDLEPLSTNVSLWLVRTDNLFRKHEFASPPSLAAGRFDAGFLVILLLPLFVLALTYNILAEERETGRLRLELLSGPAVARRLLLRAALRVLPVFLALAIIGGAAIVGGLPLARAAIWLAAGLLYVIVWTGIALVIAGLRRRSELLAVLAAGAWLLLAVLVPAGVMGGSRAIAAAPSSFEMINSARQAESQAYRRMMENLDDYVSDHPELADAQFTDDDWAAKIYVAHLRIEREVLPLWQRQQRASLRQAEIAGTLRLLSPTLLADAAMTDVAGTGHARQRSFEAQVRQFLGEWRAQLAPMVFQRKRLTADQVHRLPTFTFKEPPLNYGPLVLNLGLLILLAALVMWAGIRRLTRAVEV